MTEQEHNVKENPYEQFVNAQLILRDQLAIDRTVLANERTFLSYCRTALALVLTGAGFLRYLEGRLMMACGWGLIVFAVVIGAFGTWRVVRVARHISVTKRCPCATATPPGAGQESI